VGCDGAGTVLAAKRKHPTGLAIDDANVYWAEGGSLYACAKSGCGQHPTTLLSFANKGIASVAVDEADVYFVLADDFSSSPSWRVVRAPLDGSWTPVAITSEQVGGLMQIAIDATHVYWVRGGTEIVATPK
jgi:hypothetical protein